MDQYLPLLVMFVLAGVFAGLSFLASGLLAPRRTTPAKEAPYECGIVPDREPADRFPVRFYLVAMIFIIFDIEIVFLYRQRRPRLGSDEAIERAGGPRRARGQPRHRVDGQAGGCGGSG
jgi:hypothetical protein